jgi:hypothetical protein
MSFPSIDSPYRTSSASTTQHMHTCLLRATIATVSNLLAQSMTRSRATTETRPITVKKSWIYCRVLRSTQRAWRKTVDATEFLLSSSTNHISLCTCEKAAENGAFRGCFRHPFHHTSTGVSGRFNLFLGFRALSAQRASNAECCSRFRHPLSLTFPLPPSSERPILAPRALSLK